MLTVAPRSQWARVPRRMTTHRPVRDIPSSGGGRRPRRAPQCV